jgi:hypothetical protein
MLKSTSTLSQTATDYATPSPTSTSSVRVSEAHSTRVNFPHLQSRLLVPRVRVRPHRTHARTDTGSPLNEASKESDPGKHQDTTTVVPSTGCGRG